MALGDSYATLAELKGRLGITDTAEDARIQEALDSVTTEINGMCGRQFNLAGTATARHYHRRDCHVVESADFATDVGLIVATDTASDGTYATTLSASDYLLEPLDGIVDEEPGWPYRRIRLVSGAQWPTSTYGRPPIRVTAKWGWAEVPTPVHEATLIWAEETYKLSSAPFGVAGMDQYGPIRVRYNPVAAKKIMKFQRDVVLVA